jgi:hypothetical protein
MAQVVDLTQNKLIRPKIGPFRFAIKISDVKTKQLNNALVLYELQHVMLQQTSNILSCSFTSMIQSVPRTVISHCTPRICSLLHTGRASFPNKSLHFLKINIRRVPLQSLSKYFSTFADKTTCCRLITRAAQGKEPICQNHVTGLLNSAVM